MITDTEVLGRAVLLRCDEDTTQYCFQRYMRCGCSGYECIDQKGMADGDAAYPFETEDDAKRRLGKHEEPTR